MRKNKKVLVSAGATWVKVDDVRVLTSVFTGGTGAFLAEKLAQKGFNVTLLANLSRLENVTLKKVKIIPFRYYEEFKEKVERELKIKKYDVIIHNAAVSDYKVKNIVKGKIASGKDKLTLTLTPTEKIIKIMRKLAPQTVIIQFKLETDKDTIEKKAYQSLCQNKSDFVVANLLSDVKKAYKAVIIAKDKTRVKIRSKNSLVKQLAVIIESLHKS